LAGPTRSCHHRGQIQVRLRGRFHHEVAESLAAWRGCHRQCRLHHRLVGRDARNHHLQPKNSPRHARADARQLGHRVQGLKRADGQILQVHTLASLATASTPSTCSPPAPSSPYCPHCTTFAPTYQTLYEFYYTSAPGGSENQEADFTKFYDFRFATVNCVAYYDLCAKNGVKKYPTTILYKDGQDVATIEAVKKLADLSAIVEPVLEQLKPGTRPKELQLPNAGDSSVPGAASASTGLAKDAEPEKADSAATAAAAGTAAAAAAKTAAVWVPPVPTYEPAQPAKPAVTPNQEGKSVALSGENFQKRVTLTQSPWLVKFYAPWCQHCQAMAPDWEQLAKEMQGKLNIGEVNCDASPRLCKDAKVKGYPTIMFFKGGQRIEYDGLRGLGDLMQYADKAIDLSGGVPEVDMEAFKELEKKEKVIFVYFYDHATTTEDFLALERLPLPLIGRAKLVKTKDPKMAEHFKISTWPRLLVSREGRPTYYAPLTPDKMRNKDKVLKWMRSVWLPILPEMTASNAREIMDGKIVVLGILNRDDADGFKRAQREMRSAANEWMDKQIHMLQIERQELRDAKQLRIEEAEDRGDTRALRAAKAIKINMDKTDRKQVIFAWVDGVFWQRWIRTTYGIDVKDGERVIINDEDVSLPLFL